MSTFEFMVKGNRIVNKGSSKKTEEKKVSAGSKGEIYNNPGDFGFSKIHTVKELN